MALNTYYPNYTNPYQSYPGPYYQQPPQMTQQTPQVSQPQQNPTNILWVRNSQEAAMYPVAPNNAVVLWDSGSPVIYLNQADASGKPTMKTYDLVERVEKTESPDGEGYATKGELAALAGVVKDVDGIIAGIREDLDALKTKTPVKRVRKEEDDA